MSENKFRFYEVHTTAIVKATNKTNAEALARGRRGVAGSVLNSETTTERISASEAHFRTASE